MAILPANLNYTDKDRDAILARLQALIRSVFPTWTDFNVANFGEILLEMFAFVGGVLTYYQDGQSRESRLVTATQRKNVINLAKMLGYAAPGATAATTTEVFTIAQVAGNDVLIPAGTIVSTADITTPESFQTLSDLTIPAGQTTRSTTVENSQTWTDTFTSTGLAAQSFVLTRTPYLDDSSVINAADGTYTEVDNFLDSGPTDKHFVVVVDQNDQATISFGDGVSGSIPSATITDVYKTGGGTSGNVEPGTIKSLASAFTDTLGNPVQLSATNPEKSSGGLDRSTVAQIQIAAPASLRATTRCIAKEDYEIRAREVSGVARALLITSDNDPSVDENVGDLYIVPTNGGASTSLLKSQVLTQVTVTYPCPVTFRVNIFDAPYLLVNVFVRIFKVKGFTASQVALNIRTVLKNYFTISLADGTPNPQIDFGGNYIDVNGNPDPALALDKIFDSVDDALGVRKVDGTPAGFLLNGVHADVALLPKQFPTLGTVTIIDGDTETAI